MAFSSDTIAETKTMTREGNWSLAGCVAFYLEVYERPSFLQRNLRKALAYHREKLSTPGQGRRKLEMETDHNTAQESKETVMRFWNPKEIINILERQAFSIHDPILQINITDIRDRTAKFRNTDQAVEVADSLSPLDPIPAICSLTIWDSSGVTKVEQTRTCTIIPRRKADKQRFALVELSSPFMVPLKELHSSAKSSTRELTYSAQFIIMSEDNTNVWPPVDMGLPTPKNPLVKDYGASYMKAPSLVAKWMRLPYLPEKEEDSLMELKAIQDGKNYKPKLSLKLDAEWINADSPLATYTKEQRITSAKRSQTPAIKISSEHTIIETEWVFGGVIEYMDSITVSGYACLLCHTRRFTEPTEYHFHLKTSHDRLEFEYSITLGTNDNNQSFSHGVVHVKLVEKYESYIKRPPESISWQRPQKPFDIEKYLNGNQDWVQSESKMARTASLPKSDTQSTMSAEPNRVESKKKRKRAIEDIPALIITRKRRFKVPPAPKGISFYRTFSKVPLVEGEELSESDDDINEEWLLEKHADTIDSFTDTLPNEKLFMRRFDRHMLLEDTCSDLHAEEALVRFCKQNTAWLRRHDMKFEFAKKVASLALNHQVSNDVLVACWRIINDMSIPAESQDDRAEAHNSRSSRSNRSDRLTENEHLYARCGKCYDGIYDLRDLLACTNGQCPSKTFHLRCYDRSSDPTRPKDWICPSCTRNGFKFPKKPNIFSRAITNGPSLPQLSKIDTASRVKASTSKSLNGTNGTNGTKSSAQATDKPRLESLRYAPPNSNAPISGVVEVTDRPIKGKSAPRTGRSTEPNASSVQLEVVDLDGDDNEEIDESEYSGGNSGDDSDSAREHSEVEA